MKGLSHRGSRGLQADVNGLITLTLTLLPIAFILLCTPPLNAKEIYRCKDHQGQMIFSDTSCGRHISREQAHKNQTYAGDNASKNAFFLALLGNRADRVRKWLEKDSSLIFALDRLGQTPLHIAAREGQLDLARELVQAGAPINALDAAKRSALLSGIHAARRTNQHKSTYEMTKYLVKQGADITLKDHNDHSMLEIATLAGNNYVVEWILAHITPSKKALSQSLHFAVINNNIEQVNRLIASGADVNIQDANWKSLMHDSARQNNTTIANILMNNGHTIQKSGTTALHTAAHYGHREFAQFLIKHGVSPNAEDMHGRTPLHYSNDKVFATWLVQQGAMVNAQDHSGVSPLHSAVEHENTQYITSLVLNGADTCLKDQHGQTPLDYARAAGKAVSARVLEKIISQLGYSC